MTRTRPQAGVRVVVTCAQRKTATAPASLQLRNLRGTSVSARLDNWARALSDDPAPARPALRLYAGEHWDVVRRTCSGASGLAAPLEFWVCSAGYGLVPIEAPLRPYAATFAPGHKDSVPGGAEGAAAWWHALATWEGPAPGSPRSITDLVAAGPAQRTVLVLSQAYLKACREDVIGAVSKLTEQSNLSIISAGTKGDTDLADFLLPVDARLQHALRGTRQALNVRVAERLLSADLQSHDDMRTWLAKVVADQPALPRYDRRAVDDAEVRAFVRRHLHADPEGEPHPSAPRVPSASGRACEQARFARLFREELEAGQ